MWSTHEHYELSFCSSQTYTAEIVSAVPEVEGLKRKLANNMAPEAASLQPSWDVGECIATFWRPNFDVALYPYLPAHITRPKEVKKLFLVPMPERCYLAVRKLVCITLAERRRCSTCGL